MRCTWPRLAWTRDDGIQAENERTSKPAQGESLDSEPHGSSLCSSQRHSVNITCWNKLRNSIYVHGVWGGETYYYSKRGQYCMKKGPEPNNGKMGSGYCKPSVWLEPGRCMVRGAWNPCLWISTLPRGDVESLKVCHLSSAPHWPCESGR